MIFIVYKVVPYLKTTTLFILCDIIKFIACTTKFLVLLQKKKRNHA